MGHLEHQRSGLTPIRYNYSNSNQPMRIALLALTVFFGTLIGTQAITSVSEMQDAKMQKLCAAGLQSACATK